MPLEQPVVGAADERLVVRLVMNLVGGDYVSRWATELRRNDPAYAPVPQSKTEVARFVLDRFDGRASVASIAAAVRSAYPQAFRTDAEAVDGVRDLARRYFPDL